jgi:hypothetical protein
VQRTVENHREKNNATQQEAVGGCDVLLSVFGLTFKTKLNANIQYTGSHQQELCECVTEVARFPNMQGNIRCAYYHLKTKSLPFFFYKQMK